MSHDPQRPDRPLRHPEMGWRSWAGVFAILAAGLLVLGAWEVIAADGTKIDTFDIDY